MEACDIDQFEMHVRAVLGLPCPQPVMKVGAALMVNILGHDTMEETKTLLRRAMGLGNAGIHWYGKKESRKGRKMAHLTVTAANMRELRVKVESLGLHESEHRLPAPGPRVGIIMGSDSDLPTMSEAAEVLEWFGVSYELTIVSAHRTPNRLVSEWGQDFSLCCRIFFRLNVCVYSFLTLLAFMMFIFIHSRAQTYLFSNSCTRFWEEV